MQVGRKFVTFAFVSTYGTAMVLHKIKTQMSTRMVDEKVTVTLSVVNHVHTKVKMVVKNWDQSERWMFRYNVWSYIKPKVSTGIMVDEKVSSYLGW